ncbi:MAG: 1-acyl-sn-glycerol-3-phosphate acyltransferase [Pseudodesulfovibrio sp.]|nr:1-acyl-sn-glycerol-3-phosphate acyltransferase [Pseudodesulfovibrio sp.]
MNTLRTIWINLGIYTGTVIWTITGILASPFVYVLLRSTKKYTHAKAARKLIWIYGRVWIRMVSLFTPIHLPEDDIPSPCVLVVNHASFFDVYFIGVLPQWNVCLAVRDWPFSIPFFKPFMLAAGYINTESSEPGHVIAQSVKTIQDGCTMIYFPEGTRNSTGNLRRFYSGAFHTALTANVPVVPLCISGTNTLLPRGAKCIRPTTIKTRLLPPVYPDRYQRLANGHIAMRKDVKKIMTQALQEMAV